MFCKFNPKIDIIRDAIHILSFQLINENADATYSHPKDLNYAQSPSSLIVNWFLKYIVHTDNVKVHRLDLSSFRL